MKARASKFGAMMLLAGLVYSLCAPEAAAGSGSDGDADCDPGVPVRAKIRLSNNTGQTANDLHLYVYQNDKPHVVVNGAAASSSQFGTVGVDLSTDDGTGSPPPGNHGAQIDMSGGNIPPGGTVTIEVMLCMNERNSLKVKDIDWTFDGDSLSQPKPAPRGGWRVKRPFPGGDGGSDDPGGGGRGAQEGDGGAGNWVHIVCIENDSTTDCLYVGELKLLATMTNYGDPELIDWSSIDPVKNEFGEPPVTIEPGGKWCFEFQTTGAYLGGHVYMRYDAETVACPGSAKAMLLEVFGGSIEKNGESNDDSVLTFGDHPNPDASPDEDSDTLWDAFEEVHDLDTDDDGTGDPDNGPAGDPDNDFVDNGGEQDLLTDPHDPNDPNIIPPGFDQFMTLSAVWDFASAPLPADFFGPGSDPFTGFAVMQGTQDSNPPCPDLAGVTDTVVQRHEPGILPGVGDQDTVPIEMVSLNLVSISPITVTFNGGQNPTDFDMLVTLDPESTPTPGMLTATRTHWNGGNFSVDSFFDVFTEITFTESGQPSNQVSTGRQLQLTTSSLDAVSPIPWRHAAPELLCTDCTNRFYPGVGQNGWGLFNFEDGSQAFQQTVALACDFAAPPAGSVSSGFDLLTTTTPTSHEFGHGFPPIPADFFDPGSEPFVGRVDFIGDPLGSSSHCPSALGTTDTIIRRQAPAIVPNPGNEDTVPIEIVELNLRSVEPIQVTGETPGLWDVKVNLSPDAPSTGDMSIERTHDNGGLFGAEMIVQPIFTFTRVESPHDERTLSGLQSFVRTDDVPWMNDPSGLNLPCATDFVPGIDAAPLNKALALSSGAKVPFTLSATASTFSFQPTDLSGDSDSDGLSDFDEGYWGTGVGDEDSDDDGLLDGEEVHQHDTDPLDSDSDNDGDSDGDEVSGGSDPLNPDSPAAIWVDFAYAGLEQGTFDAPRNSVGEAVSLVPASGAVKIKGNSADSDTAETPRITKAMRLRAIGGTVRIGVP